MAWCNPQWPPPIGCDYATQTMISLAARAMGDAHDATLRAQVARQLSLTPLGGFVSFTGRGASATFQKLAYRGALSGATLIFYRAVQR